MKERVAVYVDGANIYFAQKEALGWWIDWPSFLNYVKRDRDVTSARWYQAYRASPEPEQDRFLHHLTLVGFAVRKKTLKQIYDRATGQTTLKGNMDVDITVDALNESNHFDTAIMVTGDSDFVPLVEALIARGKRVICIATQQNVAVELRQAVGVNFIDLRDLREELESDKRVVDFQPRKTESFNEEDDNYDDDDDEFDDEFEDEEEFGDEPLDGQDQFFTPKTEGDDSEIPREGETVRCTVQAVKRYGVFLDLHDGAKTLLHVKDMNKGFVPDANEFYRPGDEVTVQIVSVDARREPPEVRVQLVTAEMEF